MKLLIIYFLQPPTAAIPNILLYLLSNALSQCSSCNVKGQISTYTKLQGKLYFMYYKIYSLLHLNLVGPLTAIK
jgi:hypothetical protein